MKKKSLNKKLSLSKKTISKFNPKGVIGGTGTTGSNICDESLFEICLGNTDNNTLLSCNGCSIETCGDPDCYEGSTKCFRTDLCL